MTPIERQILEVLQKPEPELPDENFTRAVMDALPTPRQRPAHIGPRFVRGSALVGGALALMLGSPLENAFTASVWGGPYLAPLVAVLFVALMTVPAAWACVSD